MLKNLRNRLFASYLVVLVIALILVASVTITTLSQRPVPPEYTWNRLELLLTGFTSQAFVRDLVLSEVRGGEAIEALDTFAENNSVRVMIVAGERDRTVIVYDSDSEYFGQNSPLIEQNTRPPQRESGPINNFVRFGSFNDSNETQWLFAGLQRNVQDGRARLNSFTLLIAEPRSTDSVLGAFGDFNDSLLRPFMQSALIGGIVAFIFAIFLSRNITRPLQALARSAQHVAKGQFSEEVPETGPLEIQQVATAFNRMTGEVRATQQAQREFMANVSHDLKTPLTSIQGYSQAIMDEATNNPAEAAAVIYDEAERLNRMVQELTDLARLQAGRLSLKLSPLDVGEIVGSMGQRLHVVAQRENIDLQIRTGPMPIIAADGDRLVQVLTNLIGNAIKYTPSGGNVLVETGVRNGGVEIVVHDNGMGIPEADLPHIFDRFYQVDKSRGPARGTGLGLAITKEIIDGHSGKIDITSEGVNQGTTVTVWLPSPHISTIVSRRVVAQ